jgi:hypothetical protein
MKPNMISKPVYLLSFGALVMLAPVASPLAAQTDWRRVTIQVNQHQVADRLLHGNPKEQAIAVAQARHLAPGNVGGELRGALIAALQTANGVESARESASRKDAELPQLAYPELQNDLAQALAPLKDPQAIPALVGAIAVCGSVMQSVADFGQQAAGEVVKTVLAPESATWSVNCGLIALRFIFEDAHGAIAPEMASSIRAAARSHLTGKMRSETTLGYAIDLAVATNDSALRRIVQTLVNDPAEASARGIVEADVIGRIRRRAADRLAGVAATPRRR